LAHLLESSGAALGVIDSVDSMYHATNRYSSKNAYTNARVVLGHAATTLVDVAARGGMAAATVTTTTTTTTTSKKTSNSVYK
jgi:hypothetical protein